MASVVNRDASSTIVFAMVPGAKRFSLESTGRRVDECLFVLRAIAARLAPTSETRISLRKQEDAIRDLASRAEVRAEQYIRKIAGYLQQKTTELHTLNRSMEEIRIQLTTQIDHLQDQLAFNH